MANPNKGKGGPLGACLRRKGGFRLVVLRSDRRPIGLRLITVSESVVQSQFTSELSVFAVRRVLARQAHLEVVRPMARVVHCLAHLRGVGNVFTWRHGSDKQPATLTAAAAWTGLGRAYGASQQSEEGLRPRCRREWHCSGGGGGGGRHRTGRRSGARQASRQALQKIQGKGVRPTTESCLPRLPMHSCRQRVPWAICNPSLLPLPPLPAGATSCWTSSRQRLRKRPVLPATC